MFQANYNCCPGEKSKNQEIVSAFIWWELCAHNALGPKKKKNDKGELKLFIEKYL